MSPRLELATVVAVCRERARVEWLLSTRPLDVCLRDLTAAAERRQSDAPDAGAVERIGRWTARLLRNRRLTRTTCLQRALTRYALLVEAGANPRFVMGIRDGGDVEGHAWVLLDDAPWMEHSLDGLRATFEFPTDA